jgi:hypothetical protein
VLDVEAADQRDGRSAGDDTGEERPAGRRGGRAPEGLVHVGSGAARDRKADAERGEGRRERERDGQEADPGQHGGGAGGLRGERGEQQHAGAEDRAHVERGAARDAETGGCARARHSRHDRPRSRACGGKSAMLEPVLSNDLSPTGR